ncbi:MAG: hypothetical protein JSV92_00305 [archaeon]|nr:MAG: hypothetical protein JSV92_00305 [archaeon]
MRRGFCESCEHYSPFLEEIDNEWLCLECRKRVKSLNRMVLNSSRPVFFL